MLGVFCGWLKGYCWHFRNCSDLYEATFYFHLIIFDKLWIHTKYLASNFILKWNVYKLIFFFLSLIFICLTKKSHVQFTYFELFTDPIEMLELFTDLFVLVDNIDSAGLITPVRLVWELRWKRWQRKWWKFWSPVRSQCAWELRWWHRRARPRWCRSLPLSGQSRTPPGIKLF